MGISTQRGTFMLWDKDTGKPFHNFNVWQVCIKGKFTALGGI